MWTNWGSIYLIYTISAVSLSEACPFNICFSLHSSFQPGEAEQCEQARLIQIVSYTEMLGSIQQFYDMQILRHTLSYVPFFRIFSGLLQDSGLFLPDAWGQKKSTLRSKVSSANMVV